MFIYRKGVKRVDSWYFPGILMALGAAGAWLCKKSPFAASVIGVGTLGGGAVAGLVMLAGNYIAGNGFSPQDLFAVPVLVLALCAGLHSLDYLAGHGEENSGSYWCFFNLTAAAMLGVIHAKTALEFLLAWEIMGTASGFLVFFDRHNTKSPEAAWIYMVACHAGAAFLILLFFFPHTPVWMFLLALAGFGLKIGFPLFHVWLPEAHPAAPAPVSALMSGAMIELGFFGLFSFGTLDVSGNALYGWVLVLLGLIAAPSGIIFALAQSNLKRLLAYSSVENMGILSIAFGLGFLGAAYDLPEMMIGGFAGGAVHLLNHAFFKGGLFLAAGSVYKASGTLDMDEMGGLLKRMPGTGGYFIIHALSLCGLPPFTGFAGEFMIYMAAFAGLYSGKGAVTGVSVVVLVILALTGGLAAAAFAKATGAVFCGEPRTRQAAEAVEVPLAMRLPLLILFLLSLLLLFVLPQALEYCAVAVFPGHTETVLDISGRIAAVVTISFSVTVLTVLVWAIRHILVRSSGERISPTWDCGYSLPDSRMEYTATSFSCNQTEFFRLLLHPITRLIPVRGIFAGKSEIDESIEDGGTRYFWHPLFEYAGKIADRIHRFQSGNLHFYLLVIVLVLAGMLWFAVQGGN